MCFVNIFLQGFYSLFTLFFMNKNHLFYLLTKYVLKSNIYPKINKNVAKFSKKENNYD